jgi:Domain of unknown function (DUF4388)
VSAQAKGTGSVDDEDLTAPGVQAARAGAVGFRARLAGVGLWDLVQMECLARSRAVVLVTGEGGIGYLYFAHGHIVHAITADQVGEAAALEILSWTNGSFQPSDRPWPDVATIATSYEALILQVAKRRDESSNLVAFPGRNAGDEQVEDVEMFEIEEEGAPSMRTPNERELPSAPPAARAEPSGGEFSVMLRLGAHGEIVKNSGGSEEVAETVAYARRLTELAGELLGIDGFSAFECTFKESRCFVYVESNGDTVLLRPRSETNVQALRERLGLL